MLVLGHVIDERDEATRGTVLDQPVVSIRRRLEQQTLGLLRSSLLDAFRSEERPGISGGRRKQDGFLEPVLRLFLVSYVMKQVRERGLHVTLGGSGNRSAHGWYLVVESDPVRFQLIAIDIRRSSALTSKSPKISVHATSGGVPEEVSAMYRESCFDRSGSPHVSRCTTAHDCA